MNHKGFVSVVVLFVSIIIFMYGSLLIKGYATQIQYLQQRQLFMEENEIEVKAIRYVINALKNYEEVDEVLIWDEFEVSFVYEDTECAIIIKHNSGKQKQKTLIYDDLDESVTNYN